MVNHVTPTSTPPPGNRHQGSPSSSTFRSIKHSTRPLLTSSRSPLPLSAVFYRHFTFCPFFSVLAYNNFQPCRKCRRSVKCYLAVSPAHMSIKGNASSSHMMKITKRGRPFLKVWNNRSTSFAVCSPLLFRTRSTYSPLLLSLLS